MTIKKIILAIIFWTATSININAQIFNKPAESWADSVFLSLSEDERLGQLFMVAAYSNKDEKHFQKIDSLVIFYHIGGLIFFQGGPLREAIQTNRYQSLAKTPLLIGMDAEWGLNMRLDSTMFFPKQMTLGAYDKSLPLKETFEYKMGKEIAAHCRRLGIHINFAPVVDVNNNADNPVIGIRSFGEDKEKVAEKGIAYMKGMQHYGVMANAKHFPGHGDTDADSHYSLPVINHSKKRLNDVELYPFKKLMKDSLMSVMVAHIHVPIYDNRPNIATTLSPAVIDELLKEKLNFKGLVFTDALNMKGVAKFYPPGELGVLALMAGNDVLLFAEDVPTTIIKIKEALADGRLKKKELDARVKKILMAKYWAGLSHYQPIDTTHLYQDLNSVSAKAIRQEMYEKTITILKNDKNILPIKTLDYNTFASVSIGLPKGKEYQETLDNYAPFTHFSIPNKNIGDTAFTKILDSLASFTKVIVSLHDLNNRKKENYGITDQALNFIKTLQSRTNVVVVHFGNVYGLRFLDFTNNLVCAYEDNEVTRRVVPQLLFGAFKAEGKLPVTVSASFKAGTGITTKELGRLRYGYPENVGVASDAFYRVDSIISESIKDGSTPGAQLLVAKNGTVIYQKNFGYHSYDKSVPVTNNTVYDIASVTKTAATVQALMFLHGWERFDINKTLSQYLPDLKGTNKENLLVNDVLVHQAGLVPYIDLWRKTMKNGQPDETWYRKKKEGGFTKQVNVGLYTTASLSDSIWKWTIASSLLGEKSDTGCYSYKYSDLAFYFMKRIAERELNQPLEEFLRQNLYKPLGLKTLTYKPLERLSSTNIPPTEEDKTFRLATIQGTVHDQGAAMQGGVAGHAGLFGNSNDLAILGQMNLQYGYYGGHQYLKETTLKEFTRTHLLNNRRALGWDRPFPPDEISLASPSAYGHTGFTGTAWWIDPENQLVFVLLSNRTYPFADNKRFTANSVRTKTLNAVYEAIKK